MPNILQKYNERKQLRPYAAATLDICLFLCGIILAVSLVVTSDQMAPSPLRSILYGFRSLFIILFPRKTESLYELYVSQLWFRVMVNLLCALPFAGIPASLLALLGVFHRSAAPRKIRMSKFPRPSGRKPTDDDPTDDDAPADRQNPFFDHLHEKMRQRHSQANPSPIDQIMSQRVAEAEERHLALTQTRDRASFTAADPLVRVQVFSPQPQKDYLLKWEDWGGCLGASIPISSTHAILLNVIIDENDNQRKPALIGCTGSPGAREQKTYPLTVGEPLSIYRQGSSQPVRRYVITWIGG